MNNSVQQFRLRVRYADTDKMGIVYHGKYAEYLEVARVEFLRSLGVAYKDLEEESILLPVIELNLKYIAPALYDEELELKTSIIQFTGSRITFETHIFAQEKLLTIGKATLVFLNGETRRPMSCPEKYSHLFQ